MEITRHTPGSCRRQREPTLRLRACKLILTLSLLASSSSTPSSMTITTKRQGLWSCPSPRGKMLLFPQASVLFLRGGRGVPEVEEVEEEDEEADEEAVQQVGDMYGAEDIHGGSVLDAEKLLPQLEGMGIKLKIGRGDEADPRKDLGKRLEDTVDTLKHDLDRALRNMPRQEKLRRFRNAVEGERTDSLLANFTQQDDLEQFLLSIDRRWDKVPEVQREAARHARMLARKRLFGYSWDDDADAMLKQRLAVLASLTSPEDPITVPSVITSIPEAVELGMETGQTVLLQPGRDYHWEAEAPLAVLPNATCKLEASTSQTVLVCGGWELLELSSGWFKGVNLTTSGDDDSTSTLLLRGAHFVFEECDVRCIGGSCVRIHGGRSSEILTDWSNCDVAPLDIDEEDGDTAGYPKLAPPSQGGLRGPDFPSYINMRCCGLGGDDPERGIRLTPARKGQSKAHSCMDVFDQCGAELDRCTLTDCDSFLARCYDRTLISIDHCYAAFSESGFFATDHASLLIVDSCIEFIWLGSGVRLDFKATCFLKRCDVRECTYGISVGGETNLWAESCAMLNNSYSAFNLLRQEDGEDGVIDPNVTLKANQIHGYFGSREWCGGRCPSRLTLVGQNDFYDHTSSIEDMFERQGLGRKGEMIKDQDVQEMLSELKVPMAEIEMHQRELEKLEKSGEMQRTLDDIDEVWRQGEDYKTAMHLAKEEWDAME